MSRRLRAALFMILVWAASSAVLFTLIGVFIVALSHGPHLHEFVAMLRAVPPTGALIGAVAGIMFLGVIAVGGREQSIESLQRRAGPLRFFALGATAGMLIYAVTLGMSMEDRFSASFWTTIRLVPLLGFGAVAGLFVSGIGTGALALARRGRELSPGADPEVLLRSVPE